MIKLKLLLIYVIFTTVVNSQEKLKISDLPNGYLEPIIYNQYILNLKDKLVKKKFIIYMIVITPSKGEYGISLYKKKKNDKITYWINLLKLKKNYYQAFISAKNNKKIEIDTKEIEISKDLAESIQIVWEKVILQSRYKLTNEAISGGSIHLFGVDLKNRKRIEGMINTASRDIILKTPIFKTTNYSSIITYLGEQIREHIELDEKLRIKNELILIHYFNHIKFLFNGDIGGTNYEQTVPFLDFDHTGTAENTTKSSKNP